jgi:alkylated DNA repair dioxygenase AlkB
MYQPTGKNFPMLSNNQIIMHHDGLVRYQELWLPSSFATQYFEFFKTKLVWQRERIIIFGKETPCPRLTTWYGDMGLSYKYSGILHYAQGWHPDLLIIREKLLQQTGLQFNSVLCNYYRNGQDSMGWHSDDESELGKNPNIASVSLGATRRFLLKHKTTKQLVSVDLAHGSLLLMLGETQYHWQHALPKTNKECGERINLTFRLIEDVANTQPL